MGARSVRWGLSRRQEPWQLGLTLAVPRCVLHPLGRVQATLASGPSTSVAGGLAVIFRQPSN